MILLKNRDRNPSFKKGEYVEINDAGNYPMELSVDGVCEQETTKGYQLLNMPIKSGSSNGLTWVVNKDGSLTLNGTTTANTNIRKTEFRINASANEKVTLSATDLTNIANVGFKNDYTGGDILVVSPSFPSSTITLTSSDLTNANMFDMYILSGKTFNKQVVKIMLNKGDVAQPFEPYTGGQPSPSPDYPQEIKTIENSLKITSCNKNLFGTEWEKYARNNTDGTSTVYSDNYIRTKNPILVKPNNMYSFKVETEKVINGADIHYYDINKNFIGRDSIGTIFTKTIPNNCHYINIQLYCKTGIIPSDINTTQLEKGSTATSYEQHLETQITANLPEGEFIGKINDTYKDTLKVVYKEDGHYHLILNKMIGKIVLNGSETITKSGATTNEILVATLNTNGLVDGQGISNYFKYSPYVEKNKFGIYNNGKNLRFCLDIQQYATIDDFKTWLSTHNVEVYYALGTPYEIDLGIVDTLLSYDKITNVFTDSDLLPTINAKYYKDFEFDKILRSGYNIDEQEYEIAKKQMANGKRKRILSSYVDCIIKINLGLLDNKTYQEYKEQLDDGEFHYWSYKYNQYKKANFILAKPSITTEYAYDDDIGIDDMEITLEKSSDIE